jgi:hypothetical protein
VAHPKIFRSSGACLIISEPIVYKHFVPPGLRTLCTSACQPQTIKTLGEKLFTRLKDEHDRRVMREFLAQ